MPVAAECGSKKVRRFSPSCYFSKHSRVVDLQSVHAIMPFYCCTNRSTATSSQCYKIQYLMVNTMPRAESSVTPYFIIICQIQEKQDYRDVLQVQDAHHDVQYVLTFSFLTLMFVPCLKLQQFQLKFLIGCSQMVECRSLDKTISSLETELSAARSLQESLLNGSPVAEDFKVSESIGRRKYLMVIGINTAFSSRKRRDSIRYTWMPQGF